MSVGTDEIESFDGGVLEERRGLLGGGFGGERVIDGGAFLGVPFSSDAAGQVALGIDVNEQHSLSAEGEGRGEVDGGGGLTDSAFLVRDGDDSSH